MGPCRIDAPSRLIKQMELVYDSWWKTWTMEKVINYIPKPTQWSKSSYQPKINDIVIFKKEDNDIAMGSRVWRTGKIQELDDSRDGIPRAAVIQYKNATEKTFRYTRRSIRKLAVVHQEHDLELIQELNEACRDAQNKFFLWEQSSNDLRKTVDDSEDLEIGAIGDLLGENFILMFSGDPWLLKT